MMRWLGWGALLLPLIYLYTGLPLFGLLNNVEGMYAEIARETLSDGYWIIPHLNGVPYIEKPPLLYWSEALSMALFGIGDLSVRLVPATAGALTVVAVGLFGRAMGGSKAGSIGDAAGGPAGRPLNGGRFGALAAFVLGTSIGFVMLSRVAMTDALLSATLTAALLLTYRAWISGRRGLLCAGLAALGLAVLSKGLVALALYGLCGLTWLAWSRRDDWRRVVRFIADPLAWGTFLLVAGPWHLAAALTLPEFSWFYFINEHVLRFLGLREPKDYYSGTVFYYLPRLGGLFLPWALLLPFLGLRHGRSAATPAEADLKRFLWSCVLAPLVFFSVSSAKANYYVLVCLPGLALLVALWLDGWLGRTRLPSFLSHGLLLMAGLLVVPAGVALLDYARTAEVRFSARTVARFIVAQPERLPVFLYQDYEDYSALPFYLQSPVGSVDERSADLRFGLKLQRDPALFPTVEAFAARPEPALLIVLDARQRDFAVSPLAHRVRPLARIGNATLYRWPGAAPAASS